MRNTESYKDWKKWNTFPLLDAVSLIRGSDNAGQLKYRGETSIRYQLLWGEYQWHELKIMVTNYAEFWQELSGEKSNVQPKAIQYKANGHEVMQIAIAHWYPAGPVDL